MSVSTQAKGERVDRGGSRRTVDARERPSRLDRLRSRLDPRLLPALEALAELLAAAYLRRERGRRPAEQRAAPEERRLHSQSSTPRAAGRRLFAKEERVDD